MVGGGLTEKVTFDRRSEGDEGGAMQVSVERLLQVKGQPVQRQLMIRRFGY